MSILITGVLLTIGYVIYRFLSYKNKLENEIRDKGGVDSMYSGFVDTLKNEGLEVRELTSNSVYLHYGSTNGKIGAELIVTGPQKAEVTMGQETPLGRNHEEKKVIRSSSSSVQANVAEEMLSSMPLRESILPRT